MPRCQAGAKRGSRSAPLAALCLLLAYCRCICMNFEHVLSPEALQARHRFQPLTMALPVGIFYRITCRCQAHADLLSIA